jgi:hypothetical protein
MGNSFSHACEAAEGEWRLDLAIPTDDDHQFVDLVHFLILVIDNGASKGAASTSSIRRRRRRSETIRVLSGEVPYYHHLSKLGWKADCPLTSSASIRKLANDAPLSISASFSDLPKGPVVPVERDNRRGHIFTSNELSYIMFTQVLCPPDR